VSSKVVVDALADAVAKLRTAEEANRALHAQVLTLQKRADVAEQEREEEIAVRERLSQLLSRTAAGLKGPPSDHVMHDWSDLPKLARNLRVEVEGLRESVMRLTTEKSQLQLRIDALQGRK
jgi:adenosine deaminase